MQHFIRVKLLTLYHLVLHQSNNKQANCMTSNLHPHTRIMINNQDFNTRIQDAGCKENHPPKRRYNQAKTLSVGPEEHRLFYHHLTSIAIDYVKVVQTEKIEGRGWYKILKNITNIKRKIVEMIISQRMLQDVKYVLSQDRIVRNLFTIWGSASASEGMYYNDKLRLFGLIMTRENNRSKFENL